MLVVRLSLRLKDTLRLYILGVIQGYAFAWAGHFWVEKNKPATFKVGLDCRVFHVWLS